MTEVTIQFLDHSRNNQPIFAIFIATVGKNQNLPAGIQRTYCKVI